MSYAEFREDLLKDPDVREEYDLIKKREEIRERMEKEVTSALCLCGMSFQEATSIARVLVTKWLKQLHSQNVAIVRYPSKGEDLTGFGIVKVESLIKEG